MEVKPVNPLDWLAAERAALAAAGCNDRAHNGPGPDPLTTLARPRAYRPWATSVAIWPSLTTTFPSISTVARESQKGIAAGVLFVPPRSALLPNESTTAPLASHGRNPAVFSV